MYAVITRADIDSKRPDEAAAMLTGMVVPAAAAASAEAQGGGPPPGSPVSQVSVEVMEVTVSA